MTRRRSGAWSTCRPRRRPRRSRRPRLRRRPPPPPPPPPLEEEDVVEINLEEDGLAAAVGVGGEEELIIEVEGEEVEAPTSEPTSVAEALAIMRQGAPEKARSFSRSTSAANPGDVEAWEALIEARGMLGDSHGVRDGFLRLASLHRRAARFEEARAAYKGALDADPRSAAAARGLADLLVEEDAAAAPPRVAAPRLRRGDQIDLFDQEIGERQASPNRCRAGVWSRAEAGAEPARTRAELEPEPVPEPEPELTGARTRAGSIPAPSRTGARARRPPAPPSTPRRCPSTMPPRNSGISGIYRARRVEPRRGVPVPRRSPNPSSRSSPSKFARSGGSAR